MKKQQGFTLIELMIVVAVIGVLSAIAIPKYQEYVKKGALGSALATVTAYKTNIEDSIATSGNFPYVSAAFGIGNINAASAASSAGSIVASITKGAGKDSSVKLARDSDGVWTCTISGASTTITGCN
ncbi:pilin [Photobacterium leiognathi]|uniref:Fimbrial protein n=1 Tax=Photobacterium leiognathi lrivu.4.1 TaxID=1248232 RepID=A0A0U1P800_PHOLE|nr:prepilin-type N-terminal cleavage/methylation domain-containing protein [Photobacterium leiognathi]GAD30856.1 fimbrial protein [Photobacterium leiognathi lrivu.4.1]